MNVLSSLAIIGFAGLIHASFQLSVSVLTLLSSHTIGKKSDHNALVLLSSSFIIGVVVMTLLIVSTLALLLQNILVPRTQPLAWAIAAGLMIGVGVAVWVFYYRREPGTTLWLPRGFARHLTERTKATTYASEAFNLGLSSVIAELLFIIAPVSVAALTLISMPPQWQIGGICIYVFFATVSSSIVYILIGGGHKLSRIQKWRETNKRFLQFTAGGALLVLGVYIYVERVITVTVMSQGVMQ